MPARSLLLLLALLGWGGCAGVAGEVVRLDEQTTELSLTPYVSFFRDPSGRMTWDEVRRPWAQGQFALGADPRPSLGFTADAIWMRVRLAQHGPIPALWIVELGPEGRGQAVNRSSAAAGQAGAAAAAPDLLRGRYHRGRA